MPLPEKWNCFVQYLAMSYVDILSDHNTLPIDKRELVTENVEVFMNMIFANGNRLTHCVCAVSEWVENI